MLDQIKADSLAARKTGDKVAAVLLTTVYAEAANIGKNDGNRATTDAEVVAVVKKFIKGMTETADYLAKAGADANGESMQLVATEKAIMMRYMPKQLGDDELTAIISKVIETLPDRSPKGMGAVMQYLKANHGGQYDSAAASRICKAILV